jgi:translation initiation factor 1
VHRSTKGRKGKTVSVISGLQLNAFEIAELARELKQRCGTGGTAKNDVIEIQGDHIENIVRFLCARGYDAK